MEMYEHILENQKKLETKIDEISKTNTRQYTEMIKTQTELKVSLEDLKGIREDIKDLKNVHDKDLKETNKKIDVIENKLIVLENKEENVEKTTNQLYKYFISALVTLAAAVIGYIIFQTTGISL